jgi:Putative phage serine protease XkdF
VRLSDATAEHGRVSGDKVSSAVSSRVQNRMAIRKLDDELQVVWGEVFVPGFPDSQGDIMSRDQVRVMAWKHAAANRMNNIDVGHDQVDRFTIVETFVARDNDPDFIAGSWVIGVHVDDATVWAGVKDGTYNGFSLDGVGYRVPVVVEYDLPDELNGETTETNSHVHRFAVKFATDGTFLGGSTTPHPIDGHIHRIVKGTVTETVGGHNHRFSFLEGVLDHA